MATAAYADTVAACTQLFVDYARHVDFGDYDRFVELFTEDAVLELGFRLEGRAQIQQSMTKRSPGLRSRHVLTNISVDVRDDDHASGIAYLTLYRHDGEATLRAGPIEDCSQWCDDQRAVLDRHDRHDRHQM